MAISVTRYYIAWFGDSISQERFISLGNKEQEKLILTSDFWDLYLLIYQHYHVLNLKNNINGL